MHSCFYFSPHWVTKNGIDIKIMSTVNQQSTDHQPYVKNESFCNGTLSTSNWHQLLVSIWCHLLTLKIAFSTKCFFNQHCIHHLFLLVVIFWTHSWRHRLKSGILMLCHDTDQILTSIWVLSIHRAWWGNCLWLNWFHKINQILLLQRPNYTNWVKLYSQRIQIMVQGSNYAASRMICL